MKYGVVKLPVTSIYRRGWNAVPEQVEWAKEHKSNGRYNYHADGLYNEAGIPSIKWNFTNEEDAILFALKFPCDTITPKHS